jgi:xanthine/CO dehydrogenase XdhC/CoxF family maturation factor
MKEHRQIVRMCQQGEASVLVTLVKTKGSSYRQPGAHLLLGTSNNYAGTISGGCLEAEVVRKAAWLVRQGAIMQQYSTMFDDTADIPFGLGCGGVVDLLLEPTDTPEFRELMRAMEHELSGREATVLTLLPGSQRNLARLVLSPQADVLFASESISKAELDDMRARVLYGDALPDDVFVERLVAPQRLFVLGAGDDAKPLVDMAAILGWNVTVMDSRTQLARADRFPGADCVSVIRSATSDLQLIQNKDAVVVMTHSYEQDRDLLAAVLPLGPGYLGVLGARHRTSLLMTEVAANLGWSVAECCERIQAPVGLNLGGDGPEAIALSVISEIQAYRTGKLTDSRKLSLEDVESFVRQGGSMLYQQTRCALNTL